MAQVGGGCAFKWRNWWHRRTRTLQHTHTHTHTLFQAQIDEADL